MSEEEQKSLLSENDHSPWGLEYGRPRHFVEPVCGGRSIPYVMYRYLAASLFVTYMIYAGLEYEHGIKWLISLTHWMILLVTVKFLIHAAAVTYHFCTAREFTRDQKVYDSMPHVFRAIWCLHNITSTIVPLSCITYWIGIYDDTDGLGWLPIMEGMVVPLVVLIDFIISGLPMRLRHIFQPVAVGCFYIFFTIIFWVMRGRNDEGHHHIYNHLNYKHHPAKSLGYGALFSFACIPSTFLICLGLHWLISLLGCDQFREKPKY